MLALALLMCNCPGPTPVTPDVDDRISALVAALKDKDGKTRAAAVEQLNKMGPAASAAAPDLVELMEGPDEDLRGSVYLALQRIGRKSVPPLVRALGSRQADRRLHAARALIVMAQFPETAPFVIPTIPTLTAAALGDPDQDVRRAAAGVIACIGGKEAATALLTLLKRGDDLVRGEAAAGLRDLDPALVKPAVPALLDRMDDYLDTASAARQALLKVGDAEVAAGLAELLNNPAKKVTTRCDAAYMLGRLPRHSAVAVPALVRASRDTDPELREWVASALGELGADAREAAPTLRRLLSDAAPKVRIEAAVALYAVRGSDAQAVQCLIDESRNPDPLVRGLAVYKLGKTCKDEKGAVDALITGLGDQQPYVRRMAADALKAVGLPAAARAVPALEKLLDDPDADVGAEAKKALEDLKSK